MIFSPLLKKGILLLAFCGVLGGGVLSAQETRGLADYGGGFEGIGFQCVRQ